jgi:hypothetical protein
VAKRSVPGAPVTAPVRLHDRPRLGATWFTDTSTVRGYVVRTRNSRSAGVAQNKRRHGSMHNVAPALDQVRRGRTLRLAFVSAVVSLVAAFAAVGSTIPLFNIYRAEDGFTNAGISMTVVAYSVGTIGTLLVLGRLSNYVGRRPTGVPVPDVQRVMGHERPTTTLAIYTHVQSGSQERVLGALAAFSLLPRAENEESGDRLMPCPRSDLRLPAVGDTGFEPVTSSV